MIDIFIDSSQNYFFRVKGDNPITNYRPDNLEWTTAQQNVNAYQTYRLKETV